MSNSQEAEQSVPPLEQISKPENPTSSSTSSTPSNPAQVAPEELITSSQPPANFSETLHPRNPTTDAVNPPSPSTSTAPSVTSKKRKKSKRSNNFLSLLLCCSFGSGSLLDDKDGSRGGDVSASEPQSERVLDRPAHQADQLNTTSSPQTHPVTNLDELTPSTQHESTSSIENPIALRPITNNSMALLPPVTEEYENKKCLVLDLDETLIHSSFKFISNPDYIVPVEIENQYHNVYVLKRPGVDEFLRRMGELYEIVVFTASVAKYADPVLDILDIHKVINHRLCRDACYNHKGTYVKDLSQLGRNLASTMILDNSPASYIFHTSNAVPVSTWFNDPHDTELTDLIGFLTDLTAIDDVTQVLDTVISSSNNAGPSTLSA
ncbi:hypothetical protein NQZ79_g8884 [Umbelopsis isabellina]|nr:hypothetical protein NQZ79_g8884 [Umbelopsis isabellina]